MFLRPNLFSKDVPSAPNCSQASTRVVCSERGAKDGGRWCFREAMALTPQNRTVLHYPTLGNTHTRLCMEFHDATPTQMIWNASQMIEQQCWRFRQLQGSFHKITKNFEDVSAATFYVHMTFYEVTHLRHSWIKNWSNFAVLGMHIAKRPRKGALGANATRKDSFTSFFCSHTLSGASKYRFWCKFGPQNALSWYNFGRQLHALACKRNKQRRVSFAVIMRRVSWPLLLAGL